MFASVRRSRDLVAYLVAQVLAGHGNRINEYAIAQDVFGRDESFDPRIDTCVRTEAWRLRRRLADYYVGEGSAETVRISFAARSFVPIFSARLTATPAHPAHDRQTILICMNQGDVSRDDAHLLADRLGVELAGALHDLPSVVPIVRAVDGVAPDLMLHYAVYRDAAALRIVASLRGGASGKVLAVETFSFVPGGRAASPVSIAQDIASMVSRGISGQGARFSVDLLNPGDRMCYLDRLLRGEHADRARQFSELRQVVDRYEERIARDPLDRATQRRLVAALGLFLSMTPTATPQIMPRLSRVARDLLAVDDRLSDVWLTLGLAASYSYNWQEAEHACREAIAISPLDPSGYILLALNLLQRGEVGRALELAEAASPLDPCSPIVASGFALTLLSARRFDAAAEVANEALAIDPGFVRLRLTLGEARMNMGQIDAALAEFDTAFHAMSQDATACGLLGLAYGLSGDVDRAAGLLTWVRQSAVMRPQSYCAEAMILLGLGARDEALGALDAAVRRGGTPGLFVANAVFDPVRSDHRFSRIQDRMGFKR